MSKDTKFEPKDQDFELRVRKSFHLQKAMKTINISIQSVTPGEVELSMPYQPDFAQQHGFIHGGITTTALDSACAFAAFSLMPADAAVLTVEFKTSLFAPAKGDRFLYRGAVLKSGRTLSFTEGNAWAFQDDKEVLIASMSATIMALYERSGIKH